jgi:hypothetical protein
MKVLQRLTRKPLHALKVIKHPHMKKLRASMLKLKAALAQEKAETREMLHIYQSYVQGQTKHGEMKVANKQFLDLLKGLGLGVFVVLPFAPITIPVIVKPGKTVGVDILPSAFVAPKGSDKTASPDLKDQKTHHGDTEARRSPEED